MARRVARLISPSPVVIEQVDKSSTTYDDAAREAIRSVSRRPQVTLSAQVSWSRSRRASFKLGGQGGAQDEATGYLVFLERDLVAAGVTLNRGDRVVSIGGKVTAVYLLNEQYAGHHGGAPGLTFWDFAARRPTS